VKHVFFHTLPLFFGAFRLLFFSFFVTFLPYVLRANICIVVHRLV
jgi:hypothetical protein